MKFEVVNDKGITVMRTESASCIPDEDELYIMNKEKYKFKIDGKIVSIKKIKEIVN